MSTSETYARRAMLENNPALLAKAEQIVTFEDETPTVVNMDEADSPAAAELPELQAVPEGSIQNDWPEPEPLGGELPPVQVFDIALLPESMRALVGDTAERMQVPLDYPAVVAVLCLAGVTNRRATIQPKAADTSWVEVPNLWGGIVAPPGLMKSPVITAITRPLNQIEAEWRAEYDSALSGYEHEQEEAELRRAAWRDQYKAAQKSGKPMPTRPDDSLSIPTPRRLITQDATAEKLHEILRDNPAGVLLIRDELSGWLATLEKPGRESDRTFFLSAWNGNTPHTMDRIGRGSVYVPACCVSMLGGIQPARLRSYLADALADGPQNDGLFQRFQLLVYPDPPQSWQYVDRPPNAPAISTAERLYHRLADLDAVEPRRFRFEPEAQDLQRRQDTSLATVITEQQLVRRSGASSMFLTDHQSSVLFSKSGCR